MNRNSAAWVAFYDQQRAMVDESLDNLVNVAQKRAESPMEVFLVLTGLVDALDHEVLALVTAAAVMRLAQRGAP